MRSSRLLLVPLLLLPFAACKKAPPAERFVAADATIAVVFPSLETFAKQGAEVLDTAATFPGGQQIDDFRAVGKSRIGFDLFDAKSMSQAGIDPKRGMAIAVRSEADEDAVLVIPVADGKKFGDTADTLAKKGLGLTERSEENGVVLWGAKDAPPGLAYAMTEKSAILAMGDGAADRVRWALAVPKDGHLGTQPGYKAATEAVGPGQALVFYFPLRGGQMQQLAPNLKMGFALGVSGAKDRLALSVGVPVEEGSPLLKATKADAGPLVAKLDPGAAWVARSDVDISASLEEQKKAALDLLGIFRGEQMKPVVTDAFDSLGGPAAFGAGIVSPTPAGASIAHAPLGLFRLELLLGLKDAAKMKGVIRQLVDAAGPGSFEASSPEGPWLLNKAGGEVGVAVEPTRLLLAVGPSGALKALVARDGSTFSPPTETAAKAFKAPLAGMYIDVAKLLGGVKALPVSAYGDDESAARSQAFVQQGLESFTRVVAVSGASEHRKNALHTEVVFEVAPAAAK